MAGIGRAERWASPPDEHRAVFVDAPGGLVGREEELTQLRGLIAGVAVGRGRSVWLHGEPGIGKSALVAAGLAESERVGCQIFASRADESGAAIPLRLLLDALRVGPDVTHPDRAEIAERLWGKKTAPEVTTGDPAVAAAELLVILVDRLCATGPVVLAVDDVQWADQLSLAVWGRLHRAASQLPLLLIASARPVPIRQEVDQLRLSMMQTDVVEIRLGPLGQRPVNTLLQRLVLASPGPRLQSLVGKALGNPLYLRELVNALVLESRIEVRGDMAELIPGDIVVPVSLGAAIATRLNFLSEPTTRALRTATLLGTEFQVEHLSVLTGWEATELVGVVEEGRASGVIIESGKAFMFRHGLIRQALYESMPVVERSALHHEAARALAAAGARAERVAEQLLALPQVADDWTLEWLTAAAPTLTSRAPGVAADLLQQLRLALDPDDPRRAQLDLQLVTALFQLARYEEIEAIARPLLAGTQDPNAAGRMAWTLAYVLLAVLRFEEALAVSGQALNERLLTAVWTARLRAMHAMIMIICTRFDEGLATAAQAEAEGNRVGDALAVGYALVAQSMADHLHRRDEGAALATVDRALALVGQASETTDLRLALLDNRIAGLFNLGRHEEGDRALGEGLALAERSGSPGWLAALRLRAGEVNFYNGRWDDAVAELDAAGDLPIDSARALLLRGFRTLIAIHRDDHEEVDEWLRQSEDTAAIADAWYLCFFLVIARATAAERDNQPEQALERLLEAVDSGWTGQFRELPPDRCRWLPDVVRLALATGDRTIAESATKACSAEASRNPLPATRAGALHCRGLLDADPALLMSAAAAYHDSGTPLWEAWALESAAALSAQRGDTMAARAAYADAIRVYVDLDAAWDIRRAEARLGPLGIRRRACDPRRRPATGWQALTQSELKVAHLIAAGMSNPDIAAELHLSRNTVQTHVSHILTKLNVDSRIGIAREALSHPADLG